MTDDELPMTSSDGGGGDSGPIGVQAPAPSSGTLVSEHDGGPTNPEAVSPKERRRRRRRAHRRARAVIWSVVVALALVLLIASRINLNYYAIQPGSAESVQQFITVPPDRAHPVGFPVLLTDVREAQVNALTYLFFKLEPNTALYSLPSITGGTAPSELNAQGMLEMSQAEQSAKTAALRHLGYAVPATPVGAVIAGTFVGTPAYGVLNVGDVVVAVDHTHTPTAAALSEALSAYHSGQTVTFSVRRGGTGAAVPVPITLRRTRIDVGGQYVTVAVGIEPEDQIHYTYPFPVSIDVTDIGGPSAGLAMTLGVIDALGGGSLTGGHTVAATGTMDAAGDVGAIGGVAQKTVAVEGAGASIFLVPPANYKDAMAKDRPGLKIYAVSTLDQALSDLEANGGHVDVAAHPAGAHAG